MRNIIFFVVIIGGSMGLQVFLSRRANRFPGLVLPAISLMLSLIFSLLNAASLSAAAIAFVLFNISTVLYLAIYFACRDKFRKNRELDKMSAQDLD